MSKRWIQFGSAVIAMIMIANLQYAWTLFVAPMRAAHKDWTLPAIQWGFTLFIFLETWITPVEGWLIDRLGPRIFLTARWTARWRGLDWHGLCAFPDAALRSLRHCRSGRGISSIAAPLPRRSNGSRINAARFPDLSPRDLARARRCSFPDHCPHPGPVRLSARISLYRHRTGLVDHSCRAGTAQSRAGLQCFTGGKEAGFGAHPAQHAAV